MNNYYSKGQQKSTDRLVITAQYRSESKTSVPNGYRKAVNKLTAANRDIEPEGVKGEIGTD